MQLTGGLAGQPARRDLAATDRRRRGRPGGRHAGDHPGRRPLRQAGPGGDRRAAQVRRSPAGLVETGRRGPALPGDDRHAHSPHGHHDALRRPATISTIRDSPPGRQQVHTYLADEEQRGRMVGILRRQAPRGTARVSSSRRWSRTRTQQEAASLEATYEALANGPLEAFRLGLIHGRMEPEEKDAVMDRFRRGEIQVLVCTSVVEVGVDVPNATLLTIEAGERFGLAQLHQLRGRISRGKFPGYCTRLCRRRQRGIPPAAGGLRLDDRRLPACGGRFFASRPRRASSARDNTACPRSAIGRPAARHGRVGRGPPRRPRADRRRPRAGPAAIRPASSHGEEPLWESAGDG